MTYYKYAERDATSQVNWADVSKKFSDEIGRIGKERDTKRAAIDKATDELVTKINEAPMGQHANANSFTASLVDQTTEDTLRMNKLLKSGDIKPSEYMNYIENQKASVTGLYDMVTGYQSVYTDKMKRMQDGDSLPFEWEGMAAVEGFGNFANTTPVIDMYGNVTMVNDATGETMSVAEQRAITKQYFNAYDIDGAMEKQKDQLGQYLTVEMTGNTKTIDDVRRQDGFIKYMDDLVAETLAGPLATSTILLQDLPGYSTSFSPGDDPNKVLTSILDPRQPGSGAQIPLVEVVEQVEKMSDTERRKIFSENADVEALVRIAKAQREEAKQWAKKDLNFRLDRIETARQEFADTGGRGPTKTQLDYAKLTDRVQYALDNWMALQLLGADVTSGDVKLTLKDGEMINIERKSADGTPFNAVQWAEQGNFLYEDPAVARNLIRQKQAGEAPYGSMTGVLAGRPAFVQQTIPNFLEKKVTTEGGEEKKVSEVVADLPKVGPIGDIDNANEAVTQLKSMFSDLKLLDADVRAHDEQTVVDAGQKSSDYADYPAISIYLPRQMEVPVVIPAYQEAYDSFFNALASAMERGIPLTEAEMKSMLHDGAQGYNNEEIRKELGLTSSTRRTSGGGGAGAASRLYNSGG
jgi:hypothetical protein